MAAAEAAPFKTRKARGGESGAGESERMMQQGGLVRIRVGGLERCEGGGGRPATASVSGIRRRLRAHRKGPSAGPPARVRRSSTQASPPTSGQHKKAAAAHAQTWPTWPTRGGPSALPSLTAVRRMSASNSSSGKLRLSRPAKKTMKKTGTTKMNAQMPLKMT